MDTTMMLTPVTGVSPERLPSDADFDPVGGDLDAQRAWKNFGGLTLEQAYEKFCKIPESYQEDFMFMGGRAFHYYFPVIETYLKIIAVTGNDDDSAAGILAACIEAQLDWKGAELSPGLKNRISDLCSYVRTNLNRYAVTVSERERIDHGWAKLEARLK